MTRMKATDRKHIQDEFIAANAQLIKNATTLLTFTADDDIAGFFSPWYEGMKTNGTTMRFLPLKETDDTATRISIIVDGNNAVGVVGNDIVVHAISDAHRHETLCAASEALIQYFAELSSAE